MTLKRIVVDLRAEEMVLRVLYTDQDGPNPGTVRRLRQVEDLTREGLRQALAALEGRVDIVGTSGFTTREDIVLCSAKDARLHEHKTVQKGA